MILFEYIWYYLIFIIWYLFKIHKVRFFVGISFFFFFFFFLKQSRGLSPRGEVANVLDSDIIASERGEIKGFIPFLRVFVWKRNRNSNSRTMMSQLSTLTATLQRLTHFLSDGFGFRIYLSMTSSRRDLTQGLFIGRIRRWRRSRASRDLYAAGRTFTRGNVTYACHC